MSFPRAHTDWFSAASQNTSSQPSTFEEHYPLIIVSLSLSCPPRRFTENALFCGFKDFPGIQEILTSKASTIDTKICQIMFILWVTIQGPLVVDGLTYSSQICTQYTKTQIHWQLMAGGLTLSSQIHNTQIHKYTGN